MTQVKTRYLLLWLLAVSCFFLATAFADGRAESRTIQSKILGRPVRYTILLPPSYDASKTRRYPILYYLHGLGDNEQSLLRGGWDLVEMLQQNAQIGEFLIATPDGGRGFYINSHDGTERYEDFFIHEFMPEIERRYRAIGTRASRGISGTSMGGYGALRFAFRYPQLFAAVSAHMPALAEELPSNLAPLLGGRGDPFGDPFDTQYWKENTPFALARKAHGLAGLKIYFDCGRQDDYGFFEGAQRLHELLLKLGVPHEFHLYSGRHDAEFVAAHLPASLHFQSQALGAKPAQSRE